MESRPVKAESFWVRRQRFGQPLHWNVKFTQGGSVIYHAGSKTLQVVTKGEATFEPVMRKFLRIFFIGSPRVESFRTTNLDGQMTLVRRLNLETIGRLRVRIPHSVGIISDESELFSGGVFVKWNSPRATLILFENGKVIIKGTLDLSNGVHVFQELVRRIGPEIFKGRAVNVSGSERLNVRYPPAPNWAYFLQPENSSKYSIKAGYYVRPGPNKKPRYYKIPNNPALVRPKVLKAYADVGVNVPPFVKNVLGIKNVVPKTTAHGPERAPNWSATKPGFYVKPGPGKLPYFYKVPAGKAAARKTVVKAYADAGVRIPTPVRNIFGITAQSPVGPRRHVIRGETVNGKMYSRYTRAQLLQIARELNIANVGERNTLVKIFSRIKNVQGSASPNVPNFILNNVPHILRNNGRVNRGGQVRQFSTLKKNNQVKIAEAFIGKGTRLDHFLTLPRKNWYKTLLVIRNLRRRGVVSPRRSPSSVGSNYLRELEEALK